MTLATDFSMLPRYASYEVPKAKIYAAMSIVEQTYREGSQEKRKIGLNRPVIAHFGLVKRVSLSKPVPSIR